MHFLLAFSFLFPAQGFELKPLLGIPKPHLCVQPDDKNCLPQFNCDKIEPVKCEELTARMQRYGDNVKLHEEGLFDYVQSVQGTADNWYQYLSPIENQTGTVPVNYFSVVNEGAQDIQSVADLASKNHQCLKKELDEIITSVQKCKTSSPH